MKIGKFVTGIIGTNCYVIQNEETKEAVIVDPAAAPSYLLSHIESEGMKPVAILLTHAHFDHIMGIDKFLEKFGEMPVYVHEQDLDLLHHPPVDEYTVYSGGYSYPGGDVIQDGDVLRLAGYDFEVIHTPGHTPGCVCYYVREENVLFSGDTLFCCSVGRTDFPKSSTSDLVRSIREKLFCLPDDTVVYPGHMDETMIGYEKTHNPFV